MKKYTNIKILENNIINAVKIALNEELSISKEVENIANALHNYIIQDFTKLSLIKEYKLNYKTNTFNYEIFGENYNINYKIYTNVNPNENYMFFGLADIQNNYIELNLCYYNGLPYENLFNDIIYHEILHIFQYSKNKKLYLKDNSIKKRYDAINKVLNNNYSDDEKIFANALYMAFEFEQDAMCHGLYGTLKHCKYITNIKNEYMKSDEYLYLYDIQYTLNNINNFDKNCEKLFNISRKHFEKILYNSYKRYLNKLTHVYQKAYNECLEHDFSLK